MKKFKIGIFGFGHMGQAIFRLLKGNRNYGFNICSIGLKNVSGAKIVCPLEKLMEKSDYVFLCVKPQEFHQLKQIKSKRDVVIISIMAGVKIKNIEEKIGSEKIVRTMPNLNLQIGKAVIGWYANKNKFSSGELAEINNLLNSFGKVFPLQKEDSLNTITAVSGSGPAYVFLFIEALSQAAQNLGFDEKSSREITLETLSGSIEYIKSLNNPDMKELINKVKSKKGTTEAALDEININKFYVSWKNAVKKAAKRAQELSDS